MLNCDASQSEREAASNVLRLKYPMFYKNGRPQPIPFEIKGPFYPVQEQRASRERIERYWRERIPHASQRDLEFVVNLFGCRGELDWRLSDRKALAFLYAGMRDPFPQARTGMERFVDEIEFRLSRINEREGFDLVPHDASRGFIRYDDLGFMDCEEGEPPEFLRDGRKLAVKRRVVFSWNSPFDAATFRSYRFPPSSKEWKAFIALREDYLAKLDVSEGVRKRGSRAQREKPSLPANVIEFKTRARRRAS